MNIRLQVFARARDLLGSDLVILDVPSGASVAELRDTLQRRYPEMRPLAPHLLFAINSAYVSDSVTLNIPNQEVACFPPVSGG